MTKRPETPPPTKGKRMWCPYCGNWCSTNYNKNGYKVLKCCGMSLNDFHVKKENKCKLI